MLMKGKIFMNKIVVTYKNADLDCVASAYAYAEYLNKIGSASTYYIYGLVQHEVNIVCNLFNIKLTNKIKEITNEEIIVVDTNTLSSVDYVKPKNIVEIIDHHPDSKDIRFCENAVLKLYEVGAVCTIIAEMFKENNVNISRESAILLYYGIISNTVNFKSKVSTEKDINISKWLKQQCGEINEDIINHIFEEKTKFDIQDLRRVMEVEQKYNSDFIIGQLEIINALEFLNKYKNNIDEIIKNVYDDYKVKFVFINMIDILNGYHLIYAFDEATILYLEEIFKIKFINGVYKKDEIVLRKEIYKYLQSLS